MEFVFDWVKIPDVIRKNFYRWFKTCSVEFGPDGKFLPSQKFF